MPDLLNFDVVANVARQIISAEWFNTLVAGAFGAFFGAWGAQAVISRSQFKQSIVTELNAINAAMALCFAICNRFVALKKQHLKPLFDKYRKAREAFLSSRFKSRHLRPLFMNLKLTLILSLPCSFRYLC
jgi:hypothetical protein